MYLTSVAAPAVSKRPKRQRKIGSATTSYTIEKMGRERHIARGVRAGGDLIGIGGGRGGCRYQV